MLRGFGWSTAFLLVTRVSAIAAVPLALHNLGGNLYAVWVLAGAVVMIQSLFDLGVASSMVRYVAVAAASGGGRATVVLIARRAALFYGLLSLVVAIPMWVWSSDLVTIVHFLRPHEVHDGALIVRWAAVAFALTNAVLVAAAVLQGVDDVAASYRGQALGWLLYLPVLVVAIRLWSPAQAVGLAWIAAYALQLLLLGRSLERGVRRLTRAPAPVPGLREMLSFGGRWQVSAWADFATFQLPRFIAGGVLSSGDLVSLDVSMRAAQLVVAPLFAFYPTVLPRAAALLARGGQPALRAFLRAFYTPILVALGAGVVVLLPIELPALAAWTGRAVTAVDPLVAGAVLIGTAAHASTGLLSSAVLAQGDARPVVRYKALQLALAAALLAAAAPIGLVALALALLIALSLPASLFNARIARAFGLARGATWLRGSPALALAAVCQLVVPLALVLAIGTAVNAWALLLLTGATSALCLAVEGSVASTFLARELTAVRHRLRTGASDVPGGSPSA